MAFVLFNLAAVAALVGIDQLIKLWAVQVLQPVGAMPLIPHVVELRFVLNPGMAFSLLSGKQLFLIMPPVRHCWRWPMACFSAAAASAYSRQRWCWCWAAASAT